MGKAEQRIAVVGLVAVVILALLLKRGGDTVIQEGDLGNITLKEGDRYEYIVLPLEMSNFDWGTYTPPNIDLGDLDTRKWRDNWDWMQTTNIGCSCDTGFKRQVFIEPLPPQPQRPTILFQYVQPPAALNYTSPNIPEIAAKATQPRSFRWYLDGSLRVKLDDGRKLKKGWIDNNNGTITYDGIVWREEMDRRYAYATFSSG